MMMIYLYNLRVLFAVDTRIFARIEKESKLPAILLLTSRHPLRLLLPSARALCFPCPFLSSKELFSGQRVLTKANRFSYAIWHWLSSQRSSLKTCRRR